MTDDAEVLESMIRGLRRWIMSATQHVVADATKRTTAHPFGADMHDRFEAITAAMNLVDGLCKWAADIDRVPRQCHEDETILRAITKRQF